MMARRSCGSWLALVLFILPGCVNRNTPPADASSGPPGQARAEASSSVPFAIEGFGATTVGGTGGTVLTVTNLNDRGPGSFRDAVERRGRRSIRFGVSGTIPLKSDIVVAEPFVTIDGSDAPGGGVALRDATLIIETHQVIVRHIRIRPGPKVPDPGNGDAITVKPAANHVVLDHVSLSWSTDETLTIYGTDVTVQWSLVAEGLNCAGHPKGCHSKGLFLPEPSTRVSVLHTLVAHHMDRNPYVQLGRTDIPAQYQFVNNVFYNYEEPTVIRLIQPAGTVQFDIVGNFYKRGPQNAGPPADIRLATRGLATFRGTLSLYVSGNIGLRRMRDTDPQGLLLSDDRQRYLVTERQFPPVPSETDAFSAFNAVLAGAGATLPCRDAVDRRVANEAMTGTGRIINHPDEVGGWPSLTCGGG